MPASKYFLSNIYFLPYGEFFRKEKALAELSAFTRAL